MKYKCSYKEISKARKIRASQSQCLRGYVWYMRRPCEITLPKDTNIHAREYKLYLPSKEELRQKLEEWSEAVREP
jgi:hypothetical protein